jgi:hypothetical protein
MKPIPRFKRPEKFFLLQLEDKRESVSVFRLQPPRGSALDTIFGAFCHLACSHFEINIKILDFLMA